jgi:hypothetical protein
MLKRLDYSRPPHSSLPSVEHNLLITQQGSKGHWRAASTLGIDSVQHAEQDENGCGTRGQMNANPSGNGGSELPFTELYVPEEVNDVPPKHLGPHSVSTLAVSRWWVAGNDAR